jgi:hypothetical protein
VILIAVQSFGVEAIAGWRYSVIVHSSVPTFLWAGPGSVRTLARAND